MGSNNVFLAIAGRFSGLGNPMNLTLSDLRFWYDGHKQFLIEESK